MALYRHFTQHPQSVGETYFEHMGQAGSFGIQLMLAGVACLVHAVLPFLFEKTGSNAIAALHQRMIARRPVSSPAIPPRANRIAT